MGKSNIIPSGMKKIALTVMTQGIILGLSIVTSFILPKYMGPSMYGYWQIYIFYLAFLNLFGLGFNDGISLFYGGVEYKKLPFLRLRSGMRVFLIYLTILTCVLILLVSFVQDAQLRMIYYALALSVPAICLQCAILTVFLSVNRTGTYNILSFSTKGLATLFYVILILVGITASQPMMFVDLSSRFIITIVCILLAREFIFGDVKLKELGWNEFATKSKAGINITLALIASSLMPVIGRIVIEWNEPIAVYGIYSFAMSLLSIVLVFTNTAGLVIFPLLKKLNEELLPAYYQKFSFICDSMIYLALLAYIPAVIIIQNFMTDYIPALSYLYILLVMCVPLGKMQLLLISYYKAFRLERSFLIGNIFGIIIMMACNYMAYEIFNTVFAVATCTTIVLTIWCTLIERYLLRAMGNTIMIKMLSFQLIMMLLFVSSAALQNLIFFALIYGGGLVGYLIVNYRPLLGILRDFQK